MLTMTSVAAGRSSRDLSRPTGAALPGHYHRIVERMDKDAPGGLVFLYPVKGIGDRRQKFNGRAVAACRVDIILRRRLRHHDHCVDSENLRRIRDCLRMISAAHRNNTAGTLFVRYRQQLVERPRALEGTGLLKKLVFYVDAKPTRLLSDSMYSSGVRLMYGFIRSAAADVVEIHLPINISRAMRFFRTSFFVAPPSNSTLLRQGDIYGGRREVFSEGCGCGVAGDAEYCGDHCRKAAKQDITEISCDCGHDSCLARPKCGVGWHVDRSAHSEALHIRRELMADKWTGGGSNAIWAVALCNRGSIFG